MILEVTPDPDDPSIWAGSTEVGSIDFDPLTLETFTVTEGDVTRTYQAFLPSHYYAIDLGYTYGAGSAISSIGFAYAEGANPNAANPDGGGLGSKATVSLVRKALDSEGEELPEEVSDTLETKVLLTDIGSASVSMTELAGGWLRVYVGLVTKNPELDASDVEFTEEAEVFSPGDIPGGYSGTLTITAS